MYLDPYERELRLISSAMSAFLWGYSKVGYERSLDWCKRLLTVSASESEHALSHEQIADIMEVPLANVDALAEGKSMEEVMATREGEEHLAKMVLKLLDDDAETVRKAEEYGKEEYAKFRAECRKKGLVG